MNVVPFSPNKSFVCLPEYIIEKIVQLLVNQRKTEITEYFGGLDFLRCLRDVLNLRATCVQMLEVVHNSRLKLSYVVRFGRVEPELDSGLLPFMDLMRRETCWKVTNVKFRFDVLDADSGILVMHTNENLFGKSVEKLELVASSGSCSVINNLLRWMKMEALKDGAEISVRFMKPLFVTWDESSPLVDELTLSKNSKAGGLSENDFRAIEMILSSLHNLTQLEVTQFEFPADKLSILPKLRRLSIGNLLILEGSDQLAESTEITELVMDSANWVNMESLSNFLCQYLPKLVSFTFFRGYLTKFCLDPSFLSLPPSCALVKTYSYLFPYFRKCTFVECYNLEDYFPDIGRQIFGKQFMKYHGYRTSIMAVKFSCEYQTLKTVLSAVENIVDSFGFLDVLSIDVSSILLSCFVRTNARTTSIDPDELAISQIFKGERYFCDQTYDALLRKLRDICQSRSLKLLIMGKTLLYKMRADVSLFRNVDNLEDQFGWNIRRGCINWISLENFI
ncbi:uncharacterized protein LOC142348398 isoform X2 [Convolutriloba macropyga]|uniref:uncharacterized protein LOC142348398 isoform X2 n=1 Tax=Convolutriloba macropyga TaxID=536237 RepID=UPI003F51D089